MKRFLLSCCAGLLLCAIIAGLRFYLFWVVPHPNPGGYVAITIPRGSSLHTIASILKKQELISDPFLFKLMAMLKQAERDIKFGEYCFAAPVAPRAILHKLLRGEVLTHALTIPEGSTLFDVAWSVEKTGLGSARAVIAHATDPALAHALGIEGHSLEGFLFPDTYRFSRGALPEAILRKMVARFKQVFTREFQHAMVQTSFSQKELVTLASLIEKETAHNPEKPLVAAVFLNRLRKGMRLECDPTVLYGIRLETPGFKGKLRKKHLRTKTSYNTYRNYGLPPGPICNPGRGSLRAAFNPAPVSYLYFVSRNDGTHQFSMTLREHNRAVARYQKSQNP